MCIFIYLCLFSCLALSSLSLALLSFALRPCCRVPAGCWPRDSTAVRPAECDVLARKRETQRASRHNIQASPPHGEATVKRHEEIKKGDPTHKCCFFSIQRAAFHVERYGENQHDFARMTRTNRETKKTKHPFKLERYRGIKMIQQHTTKKNKRIQ